MTNNKHIVIATLALIVALGVAVYAGNAISGLKGTIEEALDVLQKEIANISRGDSTLGATGTRFPHGLSTDSTSPSDGQIRTTTLVVTGTSTITESVEGLVIGNTISTVATGTVRTLYTNTTGPKLCDASTGYLLVQTNGSFAPSMVWSLGTSTASALASKNLIASSTVATTTTTILSPNASLFRLAQGETLTAIFGDHGADASTTYLGNWTNAEAGIWCQDLSI